MTAQEQVQLSLLEAEVEQAGCECRKLAAEVRELDEATARWVRKVNTAARRLDNGCDGVHPSAWPKDKMAEYKRLAQEVTSTPVYVYRWGNNAKRATMKGRKCKVICRGAMNSCLIEFGDGQRETVSRNALRKTT